MNEESPQGLSTIKHIEHRFDIVEASIVALGRGSQQRGSAVAGQVLALAGAALKHGLIDVDQTARSLASFLESLGNRSLNKQDHAQLHLLLANLRCELSLSVKEESPAPVLLPSIAPSLESKNDRIALYIESRAVSAMLHEALSQSGFLPRPLGSMQELLSCGEMDYPAAVVTDLSLCQHDCYTVAAMAKLRERFTPAPHLFCLASGDNIAARLEAVRLGATRFLKKPVDTARLIAILKGVTVRTPTETFRTVFVDDDRALTDLYTTAMKEVGIDVRTTNDPLAAPALVAEFQPDVIVTDVYMPTCNGFELAAMLRQDEALADTPILFLSSETNIQRQMAALDLGADDFLTKPVALEVLQAAVIARAKRARMLKRSRREYRQVAEHLKRIELAIDKHSIVSIGDLQGNIEYANKLFCDISGYGSNELLGANHRIVKSARHTPDFYTEMWRTIGCGRTWHGEICNRRKDGSHFWVDATITPQLDEQGRPVRYIAVRTDITLLKEMQAQLMLAKSEAEAASQAKSVFLAHISHELKTPLNSILGFAQIMQSDTAVPATPDQAEMLSAIERSGRHLFELINDLVDLAKIQTGHLDLSMENIVLPPLIRECLALLKPQAQKRGVALTVDFIEPTGAIHADRIRVKQVLLNLLSNAVKYNSEQGSVTVSAIRHDETWHVMVRESGPGISLEHQAELFLPFSRLKSTAQQVEGTGIGLALSKNLIERMSGQIGVISTPGSGSEFWFALPAGKATSVTSGHANAYQ